MSIDIDWEKISAGEDGKRLAGAIRDFVDEKFKQVQLPRFLRAVEIHAFDFGKEPPTIRLIDISEPLHEFYDDGESDSEGSGDDDGEEGKKLQGISAGAASTESQLSPQPSMIAGQSRLQHSLRRKSLSPKRPERPSISQITPASPGIPGGTSSLSYFHLPLSGNLTGSHTPTPFTPGWPGHFATQDFNKMNPATDGRQSDSAQSGRYHGDLPSRPSTSHVDEAPTTTSFPEAHQAQDLDESEEQPLSANPLDMQTTLHISYAGSISLSLTAEILLDYPMPSFVGIPLKLNITGITFDGIALLAYLRGKISEGQDDATDGVEDVNDEGSPKGKIKFCFLDPEDAKYAIDDVGPLEQLGHAHRQHLASEDRPRECDDIGTTQSPSSSKMGGLFEEIKVESEIGRKEDGKQVLKNVGKVEKFVVEQIRRIFEDEFVFPSFWTFLV